MAFHKPWKKHRNYKPVSNWLKPKQPHACVWKKCRLCTRRGPSHLKMADVLKLFGKYRLFGEKTIMAGVWELNETIFYPCIWKFEQIQDYMLPPNQPQQQADINKLTPQKQPKHLLGGNQAPSFWLRKILYGWKHMNNYRYCSNDTE